MVTDSLNLNLSQISSFTHIYRFVDFNGFVDLQIFGFYYGFEDLCISKDHLAARVISRSLFYALANKLLYYNPKLF